jgi:hypothetical protein
MDAQVTDFPNKLPRGRQPGSHVAPGLRRTSNRTPRDLAPLDRTSGAGRFFAKMVLARSKLISALDVGAL